MDKRLFLDLDETLVSSIYANNKAHADQLLDIYTQHWKGWKYSLSEGTGWNGSTGWYVTFLRSWTHEFVAWCHETYGSEAVHVLTMGTADYASKMMKIAGIDVDQTQVYAREDIHYPKDNFDMFNNVLIDNENYEYHSCGTLNKVNFLSGIPRNKLVNVPHFDVRYFRPENDEGYLDQLKGLVEKAF